MSGRTRLRLIEADDAHASDGPRLTATSSSASRWRAGARGEGPGQTQVAGQDHGDESNGEAILDVSSVGGQLRQARVLAGQDIRDIAAYLRIRADYLSAIEEGRLDVLPGMTYAIGYVRTYAQFLELDASALVDRFKSEAAGLTRKTQLVFPSPAPEGKVPGGAIMAISLVLALAVYGGWYYMSSSERDLADLVPSVPERLTRMVGLADDVAPVAAIAPVAATAPVVALEGSPAPELAPAADKPVADKFEQTVVATSTDEPVIGQVGSPSTGDDVVRANADAMPGDASTSSASDASTSSASGAMAGHSALANAAPEPRDVTVAQEGADGSTSAAISAPSVQDEADRVALTPATEDLRSTGADDEDPAARGPAILESRQARIPPFVGDREPTLATGREIASVSGGTTIPSAPSVTAAASDGAARGASESGSSIGISSAHANTPGSEAGSRAAPDVSRASASGEARIVIRADGDSWVQVRDADSTPLMTRILRAGDEYVVPNRPGLKLSTGNAGALSILIDGKAIAPLGPFGQIARNVALDPESLRRGN